MPKLNLIPTARDQFKSHFDDLRHKDAEMPATLGDGQGNVRIDQTHSWARVGENRTVIQVWNDRVPHIDGWEVVVGYEPGQNLFRVLRGREPYQSRAYSLFGEHGASHSMFHPDGGHDIAWIDIRQWMPLRVFPSSAFTVSIWWGMIYRGTAWDDVEIQTFDLTSSKPAAGARYTLITLNATGVLTATNGTVVADKDSLVSSDIPAVPSGHYPLAAVRLYDSQTAILERRDDTDIIDLRYPPYTTMAPASTSGGIAWQNVVVVAISGGDYTSIQDAVIASASGTCILIAPGTYAETVSLPAAKSLFLTSIDGARQAIIAPAAGVPLTLSPSGDFQTVNGLRLSPPAGSVALVVGTGATGTIRIDRSFIGVNGAASVDADAAAAALDLAFRDCYLGGALLTTALTSITDCDIAGNLTQATGAGNLTLEGGNLDGNLTHVTGSTSTLRNLPRIAGTVSGAGTLVGAYLNSSGHIVFVNGTAMSGFANPTGLIGMSAANGAATTTTRSDATHAIDPAITPTWTARHYWNFANNVAIRIGTDASPSSGSLHANIEVIDSTAVGGFTIESNFTNGMAFITHGASSVPRMQSVRTGGTRASPSATPSGAILFSVQTGGYDGTDYAVDNSEHASLRAVATEVWTASAQGAKWELYTTANGVTASVLTATLDSSGLTLPGGLNIGTASGAATGEARASVGFAARADGSGAGFYAGASSDVQWYRGAANRWDTPDSVKVSGNLLIVGNPVFSPTGLSIGNTSPRIMMDDTSASANNRVWETLVTGEQLIFRATNDANSAAGNWCVVDRTGTTIDLVAFPTSVKVDGGLSIGAASGAGTGELYLWTGSTTPQIRLTPGASANVIQFWKDNTPSIAWGVGGNIPGSSITDDLIFSRYDSGWLERGRMTNAGNFVWNTAAIATTATDGFIYVPSCAGTPTGTPTAYTGRVPIVVDSTNNKLYFYSGGAWRDAGP